jgi:hypothetical protein
MVIEALKAARDFIENDRQALTESLTVKGEIVFEDDIDRGAMADYVKVLAVIDGALEQALAAPVQPVAFLANGTRFKISYDSRQSGGQIHGIPPELGGRWVAFVAAEDDCHLNLTPPPAAQLEPVQEPVADAWMHKDGRLTDAKAKTARVENFQGWGPLAFIASAAQPTPVQEPVDSMGMPLSCGKPLCAPGDHHPLCRLATKPAPQPNQSAYPEYDRGFSNGWDRGFAAAQPAVPLTDEQIRWHWSNAHNDTTDRMAFEVFARFIEAAHGITKGQP